MPRTETLAELVSELRTAKGWTQKDLARQSDLTERTIGSIESCGDGNTHSPSASTLRKLSVALDVDFKRLRAAQERTKGAA